MNYVKIVSLKFRNSHHRSLWNLTHIVIHHIMHRNATINDIHNWHLQNGWSGCGYHFYIRKNGNIYQGRPLDVIGAHVSKMNTPTIGIALEGDFRFETETKEQRDGLKKIIKDIHKKLKRELIITTHNKLQSNTSCPEKFDLDNFLIFYNKKEKSEKEILKENLQIIQSAGIINSPLYWKKKTEEVKYFDIFIKNVANYVKNVGGK